MTSVVHWTGSLLVTLLSPEWPVRVRLLLVTFLAQMDARLDSLLQAALTGQPGKVTTVAPSG